MSFSQCMLATALFGALVPASATAGSYTVDPRHTYPSIEFSHMGISVWRGKFNRTTGKITLDRVAKSGTVDVMVDVASINFGLDAMDEKARSDDFFDAARYPTVTYKGKIKFSGDLPASVEGQVTIRGVTRPIVLNIHLFNCIPHPMLKREVCGADAEGELNWSEYGMKMSQYGQGAAGKVRLRIQVEAIKDE
jgi:polyisoprenoid-binding protein YceI